MPTNDSAPRPPRRLTDSLLVSLALIAILGWIFAEWLIIGSCEGLTTCPSRSWGGYYVPLQAIIAVVGVFSAGRLLLRPKGRSARPDLAALVASAALWAIVVWVHTQVG